MLFSVSIVVEYANWDFPVAARGCQEKVRCWLIITLLMSDDNGGDVAFVQPDGASTLRRESFELCFSLFLYQGPPSSAAALALARRHLTSR